jgi:hypothetical protein
MEINMHCTQEVDRHAILRLRERTIKRLHVLYQQLNIPKTINLTNNTSPQVTTNGTGSPTLHNKKKSCETRVAMIMKLTAFGLGHPLISFHFSKWRVPLLRYCSPSSSTVTAESVRPLN